MSSEYMRTESYQPSTRGDSSRLSSRCHDGTSHKGKNLEKDSPCRRSERSFHSRHAVKEQSERKRPKERHRQHHKKDAYERKSVSSDSTDSSYRKHRKHHKSSRHKEHRKKKKEKKEWGAYGVLQECDMWRKRPEFQLWLLEVKNENLEFLPGWKEKELFREYMEDYNTATLPHEKYYALDDWAKKNESTEPEKISHSFNDEELRRKELQTLRDCLKHHELESAYQRIKSDIDKVAAMRHQKILHNQMQTLFRMGHISEAEKIRNRITSSDD